MIAALGDDSHIDEQRSRYGKRRAVLRSALQAAGLVVDYSEGVLYLWASRGEPCWATVGWLSSLVAYAAVAACFEMSQRRSKRNSQTNL